MSWQAGLGFGLFGRIRLLFSTVHLWGALEDFGAYDNKSEIRPWLAGRASRLYDEIFGKVDEEDLDQAADAYVAGPLGVKFFRLYQTNWPQPP